MRGPLLQPEVRAVQVATRHIHAPLMPVTAAAHHTATFHSFTQLFWLHAGNAAGLHCDMLKMLFDRDTNKQGCGAGTSEPVAAFFEK